MGNTTNSNNNNNNKNKNKHNKLNNMPGPTTRTRSPSLEKCQRFKKNLGKLMRAHDGNWKKVPLFMFVDRWVDDAGREISRGREISQSRLKSATKARKKFGIH